ncbi:MAG TPA: tyrosine-protein phosphatase [Novosphingobium sp.]|nr:tyrosine-protein phosphatase [Novosphingobium sp.]
MEQDRARRVLALEGGINFRDMGGYATSDGKRTKWGRLYRSGTMSMLTTADFDDLAKLGIRAVVDFRTRTEQESEPNLWCREHGIDYWSRSHDLVFGNLHDMIDRGIASAEESRQIMLDGFRHLPFQQAEAYAELIRRIADGKVPIAFNCTAGKDRTGGAAALVLALLGVPRETIVADFVLTGELLDLAKAYRSRPENPDHARYKRLDREIIAPMGEAHADYVAGFLDAIDEKCGSVEGYLAGLGISEVEMQAVRAELLEPA